MREREREKYFAICAMKIYEKHGTGLDDINVPVSPAEFMI